MALRVLCCQLAPAPTMSAGIKSTSAQIEPLEGRQKRLKNPSTESTVHCKPSQAPKEMASTLTSNGLQPNSNGLQPTCDGLQPGNLLAMASNLLAMASNLRAMASTLTSNGLQPNSNGLQPTCDGLQPTCDGLHSY